MTNEQRNEMSELIREWKTKAFVHTEAFVAAYTMGRKHAAENIEHNYTRLHTNDYNSMMRAHDSMSAEVSALRKKAERLEQEKLALIGKLEQRPFPYRPATEDEQENFIIGPITWKLNIETADERSLWEEVDRVRQQRIEEGGDVPQRRPLPTRGQVLMAIQKHVSPYDFMDEVVTDDICALLGITEDSAEQEGDQ